MIVFDELYFASVHMLAKVKRYSERNPDKIILTTGDTDQLEAIDVVSDRLNYDAYMNHCIDTIFLINRTAEGEQEVEVGGRQAVL